AEELTDREQQAGAAAPQDEGGFLALEARVERHYQRAGSERAQGGNDPECAVGRPDGDAIPRFDAAGDEGGAGAVCPGLKLPEAQRGPFLADRRGVAEELRGARQDARDGRGYVGVHTLKIANHTVRCDSCCRPRLRSACPVRWSSSRVDHAVSVPASRARFLPRVAELSSADVPLRRNCRKPATASHNSASATCVTQTPWRGCAPPLWVST